MRRVSVVGIGAGDPDDITVAAIRALEASDMLFVIEKPGAREGLARARREIVARHVPGGSQRIVQVEDPERDRSGAAYVEAGGGWGRRRAGGSQRIVQVEDPERDRSAAAYVEAVEDWRRRRADVWEGLMADLADGERGAFLVWGGAGLYDSTHAGLDGVGGAARRCRTRMGGGVVGGGGGARARGVRARRRAGDLVHRRADGAPPDRA